MPTIFPAIIRAQYEQDSGGFPAFESAFQQSADRGRQSFEKMYADIKGLAKSALSLPSNATGSLNIDSGAYRAAADAAERNAVALREIATAARRVADADPSPALHRQAQAASAAAIEARTYAQTTAQEALAMERLQGELNRTKTATDRLASAGRASIGSIGAQRQAYVGVGQQLQDTVISLQGGQRASTVFAQQMPQLAYALSGVGGAVGRVATTLAGPWGIALVGASFLLGGFVDKLFKSKEAADLAKVGADGLSDAQSVLGGIFDLTSGKIESQNELLRLNARLTAINLRAEALKASASAGDVFANAGRVDSANSIRRGLQRGSGGPLGALVGAADTVFGGRRGPDRAIGNAQNLQSILSGVKRGTVSPEDALRLSETQDFTGTKVDKAAFQQAIIDRTASEAKQKIADLIDQSLNDGKLAAGLRKADHSKPKKGPKGPSAESIANKAFQSTEFGQDTAAKILGITEQFDRVPAAVAKVNATMRQLDDLATDIEKRKPPNYQALLDQIDQARPKVQAGLVQPLKDMIDAANEQAAVQELLIAGRSTEAEVLTRTFQLSKQMGPLTADQVTSVRQIVTAEHQREASLEKQRDLQQRQLEIVGRTQDNVRSTIGDILRGNIGKGIGNLFKRQFDIVIDGLASDLTESLFGDGFRKQREHILGIDQVSEAGTRLADEVDTTSKALGNLTNAITAAAQIIGDQGSPGFAANDNSPAKSINNLGKSLGEAGSKLGDGIDEIVVTAQRTVGKLPGSLGGTVKGLLNTIFGPKFASGLSNTLSSVLGSIFGGGAGGIAGGGGAGGGIAGILGSVGAAAGPFSVALAINQAISKALGNDQIKNGKLGDLTIGPILTSLVGKALKGSATLGFTNGNLGVGSTRGNSSSRIAAASSGIGAVATSLNQIADALGGNVTGAGSVSLGIRKKDFVVDPTGQGRTKGSGVLKFKDQESATRAALLDAINDGAVAGIRQGAQNLLRAGADIEKQLSKAVRFNDVFKQLKALKDPVGAALDDLFSEFTSLKSVFTEASASAADFAALEELYGLKRAEAIKQATEQLTGALSSLISDLKTGDNGLSLRDRLFNARQAFDPLANDVRAGKTVDYDKFATDAKQVIDIQRQLSGSTNDYFNTFNEVLSLSEKALTGQQNVISIASAANSPFTTPTNATTPVVTAISQQTLDLLAGFAGNQALLAAMNGNLGSILSLAQAKAASQGAVGSYSYARLHF